MNSVMHRSAEGLITKQQQIQIGIALPLKLSTEATQTIETHTQTRPASSPACKLLAETCLKSLLWDERPKSEMFGAALPVLTIVAAKKNKIESSELSASRLDVLHAVSVPSAVKQLLNGETSVSGCHLGMSKLAQELREWELPFFAQKQMCWQIGSNSIFFNCYMMI